MNKNDDSGSTALVTVVFLVWLLTFRDPDLLSVLIERLSN